MDFTGGLHFIGWERLKNAGPGAGYDSGKVTGERSEASVTTHLPPSEAAPGKGSRPVSDK